VGLLAQDGTGVETISRKVTLKGNVTEFVYKNPRVQIGIDVKDLSTISPTGSH